MGISGENTFMQRSFAKLMRLIARVAENQSGAGIRKAFPDGHFYSPIVDIESLRQDAERVWPNQPVIFGIDFNDAEHLRWLGDVLPRHLSRYDYPDEPVAGSEEYAFHTRNPAFSWLDARMLFAILQESCPSRMMEIGSGYSSLLAADVNRRFLDGQLDLTCIEPYPRDFLRKGVPGITRLIERRVQDVPLETFRGLESGDILFIDSSHVAKTGSDVNFIYFEILPRLREGVLIHIHDIFLPEDYPKDWIFKIGLNWNEQYIVRALLMYSHGFEVLFSSSYALARHPTLLGKALSGQLFGGGSLWLRKRVAGLPDDVRA